MPAPYKRKKHSGKRPEDSHDAKRPKQKHGRQEMRTITRTARRVRRDEEDEEDEQVEENVNEELESQADDVEDEDGIDDDKGKAYDALLTLLSGDHQEDTKKKTSVRAEPEQVQGTQSESDEDSGDDEIAGANVDEDKDVDEEGPEEDDGDDDQQDPFEVHFNQVSDTFIEEQEKVLKDKPKWTFTDKKNIEDAGYTYTLQVPPNPIKTGGKVKGQSVNNYSIKQRLVSPFEKQHPESLNELEGVLLDSMVKYQDINYVYKTFDNESYKKLYVLHALNHIFKTRDRILKNNNKLHSYQESMKQGKTNIEEPELRDQGFTRPKVLILLPTRNACYEIVELLIKLCGSEQQENRKKFSKQFFNKETPPDSKPEDFKHSFRGNNNDFFCIGLKFTRKSLKLYSSFYSSDIIIASPIGLSMILENPDKKKRQYDFLSSIEVLVVDRANQIEMQNWDHVNTVFKYLNKIPKDFHDADFSRIRMWSINDQANLLRQNLVFSEFSTPNINNIVSSKSLNLSGKLRFKPITTSKNCIMNSIGLKLKQIFQRFESGSPMTDPESRFKFFINSVLPSLTRSTSYDDGLLIFIPSYYDYLRIKNYMKTSTKFTFASIDEYSSQSKLSRNRQQFASGKIKIMLYTERLHHFRRFEINGVKNLLMYGLPSNPVFYKELVRFIGKSVFREIADLDLSFIKILYSKWDAVSLERVVGNERAPVLCNSVNEMYEFR
ncbi:unnamed protein product [Debaryomyces tyrocola]|nr:unnamed protein product [Debaryomyces tyrocola]